tara:strand:+ start:840 stop:1010 length:171 start_codon:yes stop_codon:yes gene_type:complete
MKNTIKTIIKKLFEEIQYKEMLLLLQQLIHTYEEDKVYFASLEPLVNKAKIIMGEK